MINQLALNRFRVAFTFTAKPKIQVGSFSNVTPGRPFYLFSGALSRLASEPKSERLTVELPFW